MILEKKIDDFRNQNHIIPPSHSSPDFSAYATSTLLRHIFSISCLPDNITHTILQTVRLVINLLQHKVIKTTLAQLADVQIHGLDIVMTGRMLHDRSRITGDTLRTQPRHRQPSPSPRHAFPPYPSGRYQYPHKAGDSVQDSEENSHIKSKKKFIRIY